MPATGKIRFMSLSSGSNGNCYWLEGSRGGILIDAGVSLRALKTGLQAHGIPMERIKAVIVTHDHSDHIRNLGSYCKKLLVPVWVTETLRHSTPMGWMTGPWLSPVVHILQPGIQTEILPGSISVSAFEVPHDATQTLGYAIDIDGYKLVIMTDIGQMTPEALAFAGKASTVIIEANYDPVMLANGPYPPDLQARIRGGYGHLANFECAEAVKTFRHEGLANVFLCHLSAHNNTPETALDTVRPALEGSGVRLVALPRTEPSPMFEL